MLIELKKLTIFNHGSINKIKLIFEYDNIYCEKILSEPGDGNTKFNKKIQNINYRINYSFGWELFIEKENLENIFKDLFIENNNLIIDTLKIDKDSVFKDRKSTRLNS